MINDARHDVHYHIDHARHTVSLTYSKNYSHHRSSDFRHHTAQQPAAPSAKKKLHSTFDLSPRLLEMEKDF